jgi:hypothetical protein
VLGAIRFGHQHRDVAADDLGRPVAEDALRRGAELLDVPAMVDDDDGVHRGIEQRTELEPGARAGVVGGAAWSWMAVVEQDLLRAWVGRKERIVKERVARH